MGTKLASTIRSTLTPEELSSLDVVIPIPETANTAAQKVSKSLKKPFAQGFVKNRYVFRTFIMPGQRLREKGVPPQAERYGRAILRQKRAVGR